MAQRRRFSAEYKREAVAILQSPGVSVSQEPEQAFVGNGRPRDEELAHLLWELALVTKERDFLREAAACFASASR